MSEKYIYTYKLPFEASFDMWAATTWMRDNWTRSIVCAVLYLGAVRLGLVFMQHRAPLQLRLPLAAWNIALALFSILGTVRVAPEFFHSLFNNSFEYSICSPHYAATVSGYYAWIFAWSKLVELGDTFWIIVRKQKLIFLHWYHHATVLIYTWFAFPEHTASARWFIAMNYTIHSLMYAYYAARALRWRHIPRWIPMLITTLQTAQMCLGIYINYRVLQIKAEGRPCQQSDINAYFALFMYATYALLFLHYFYQSYISPSTVNKGPSPVNDMRTDRPPNYVPSNRYYGKPIDDLKAD